MRRALWDHHAGSGSPAALRARLWVARLLLLFPLIWCPMTAANNGDRAPGQFHIRRDGEHLTIRAQEVPQQELLEALAERLDFKLTIKGHLPQPRSLHIEGRPWEQALKQALSPANWALQYKRIAGQDRLMQVVVFPSDTQPHAERRIGYEPATPDPPQFVEVERSAAGKDDQAQDVHLVEPQNTDPSAQSPQGPRGDSGNDYDNSATSQ